MSERDAKLYRASTADFNKVPSRRIAYWVDKPDIFLDKNISNYFISGGRNKTHNDEKYLRYHWEVEDKTSWVLYAKGGDYRKWYGNEVYVVNWTKEARNEYASHGGLCNPKFWNTEGITWSLTSSKPSFRVKRKELMYSSAAPTIFNNEKCVDYLALALLNSSFSRILLDIFNPTLSTTIDDVFSIPYNPDIILKSVIDTVKDNIGISKIDWDSFEVSRDFQMHPFLTHKGATLEESYKNWEKFADTQFAQLKSNEEELNRIFIDIYGLQDELNPEVKDEDVTIRKADVERDVKSFISYAVGCMFGRYSIDKPGLILANAGETVSDYQAKVPNSRFEIDDDNIIPVLDDDYFHDDIVSRFREFLKVVYGKETLEQNMSFIAHALSPESKSTPDKVLRDYFLKDFYTDHLKVYQKRPIYWMFTSGKQQGFNVLIYLHRYNKDTLGKIWGDYLRELEAKLDAEISLLENADKKNTSQLAKLKKQRIELKEYDSELDIAASQKIEIDLDDGVAVNYAKFGKLVRPLK